jgi:rhodanese-related sulfurtransferase
VLDVREADEWAFCHIDGAEWIPLGELQTRSQEIPADRAIVCMCHRGMRSAMAQRFLLKNGFKRVFNLTGGIHAWSRDVDPGIPTY